MNQALHDQANANDADGGVLEGNWTGKYPGGRSPTQWNGSVAMLEEYMATRRSVKYAQCWVFSGLITTCETFMWSNHVMCLTILDFDESHYFNNYFSVQDPGYPS